MMLKLPIQFWPLTCQSQH